MKVRHPLGAEEEGGLVVVFGDRYESITAAGIILTTGAALAA